MQALVAEGCRRVGLAERHHQRVRAPPRRVLLLAGRDVGRAHRPGRALAAQPDVHAPVGRASHAADHVEGEPGAERRGPAAAAGSRRLSVIGGASTILPGFSDAGRVEERLEPRASPRRGPRRRRRRLNSLRASPSPCSLAFDAAELRDEVLHLGRDGPHRRHLAGVGEVDERPHVQAAHRCVPVEAGRQPVPVQHGPQPAGVVGEPGRVDRGVLDERDRPARARRGGHQQPEARPSAPSAAPPAGRSSSRATSRSRARAAATGASSRSRPPSTSASSSPAERDEQQRLRVALQAAAPARRTRCFCRERSRIVRSISSTCAGSQASASPVASIAAGDRSEVADGEHRPPRRGHEVDQRRASRRPACPRSRRPACARSSGAPSTEPVEPVAAGPAPEGRVVVGDRRARGAPAAPAARRRMLPSSVSCAARRARSASSTGSKPRRRAVGEHDVQRPHVVDGHAVAHAAAAGRVVADHPADRGAVAGRGVRAEHQAVRAGGAVEVVLHDAGVDESGAGLGVDAVDAVACAGTCRARGPGRRSGRPGWCPRRGGRPGRRPIAAAATAAATSSAWRGKATPSGRIAYMLASRENRCRE